MTQLEFDIDVLLKKQLNEGLTGAEKQKLSDLQDEWIQIESSQYGACLSCHI
jgi:RNA polymerase-binding transcription factor DksA